MKSTLHMHDSYVRTAAVTLHCIFFQHSKQSGTSQCPERWQNICLPYISFPLFLLNFLNIISFVIMHMYQISTEPLGTYIYEDK
jgi:hypothetical protein